MNPDSFIPAEKMQKRLLLQFAEGAECQEMLLLTKDRIDEYTQRWGANYQWDGKRLIGQDKRPSFNKLPLIIEALEKGYQKIIWLDVDTVIADMNFDLFALCNYGIGFVKHHGNPDHLNAGVFFVRNSPEVLAFFKLWNSCPDDGHCWYEQAPLQNLAAIHYDLITILPNRFNSQPDASPSDKPVIRAFHGLGGRVEKMTKYMEGLK